MAGRHLLLQGSYVTGHAFLSPVLQGIYKYQIIITHKRYMGDIFTPFAFQTFLRSSEGPKSKWSDIGYLRLIYVYVGICSVTVLHRAARRAQQASNGMSSGGWMPLWNSPPMACPAEHDNCCRFVFE